jgi:3-dehydroquinate dehydratase / shikimate dehydrogenase
MLLCIPITAKSLKEAFEDIASANPIADWIELRLDYLEGVQPAEVATLVQACQKPTIAVHRGENNLPWLQAAYEAGADLIDSEQSNHPFPPNKTLYSRHLDSTPSLSVLQTLYQEMKRHQPRLVKIVPTAHSFLDNVTILQFLHTIPPNQAIAFCMGEKGLPSRYYCTAYGSFCTFGSLSKEKQSAAGQPPAQHLKSVSVNKQTSLCGVIGHPIAHSLSPAVHQAAYQENHLNYLFLPFNVKPEDLEEFLLFARQFPMKGIAVTIPHKETAIPFLDTTDPVARQIGAVNTIVNHKGKLEGFNTDIDGAIAPLLRRTKLMEKKAVVLGSGGAARAFVYGLSKEGAKVTVISRNPQKADSLALSCKPYDALEESLLQADILINATPIGLFPHIQETPVPAALLHPRLIVFDSVYNPLETRLLQEAKHSGCHVIPGIEMFLNQALKQFGHLTGTAPPEEVMQTKIFELLSLEFP